MREIISTLDNLVRTTRYLSLQLEEIARIAGHDHPTNDEEHDALHDCAEIARHAIEYARQEIASTAGFDEATKDEQHVALLDCAATARHVIEYVRKGGAS